jgi:hypothetical protein
MLEVKVVNVQCRCGEYPKCDCAPWDVTQTRCDGQSHYEVTGSLADDPRNHRPCDCEVQ